MSEQIIAQKSRVTTLTHIRLDISYYSYSVMYYEHRYDTRLQCQLTIQLYKLEINKKLVIKNITFIDDLNMPCHS